MPCSPAFNSAGQRCSALRVLLRAGGNRRPRVLQLLARLHGRARGRRSGAARDRRRPGDRRGRARTCSTHMQRDRQARARWRHRCALAREHARGLFFAPLAVEIDRARSADARSVRPGRCTSCATARAISTQWSTRSTRRGYGLTLGIHTRIDATARASRSRAARRQRLRQSQHDRRRRRRAAVRRHGPVGHRAEGGRAALSASLRHRADRHDQHGGGRRQREFVDDRGVESQPLRFGIVSSASMPLDPFELAPALIANCSV